MTNNKSAIAIIGGGIAGLYCCYKLATEFPDKKIILYEATEKLGGRIETWSLKRDYDQTKGFETCDEIFHGIDKEKKKDPWCEDGTGHADKTADYFRAEFGPMRIEPEHQDLLKGLLTDLGIREGDPENPKWDDLVAFPSYAGEDPEEPKFTLVGEEHDQNTLLELLLLALRRICELLPFKGEPKAPLAWNAKAWPYWNNFRNPSSVHQYYWKGHLRDWINALNESDYDNIRRQAVIDDVPLWDMGFWNLLSGVLSPMAVVKLRDWASFYHLLPENPNAAEWLVFWLRAIKSGGELRGIRGGMYRLVWQFKKKIESLDTVEIITGAKLVGLSNSNGCISLKFYNAAHNSTTERVILAIPKRPLEQVLLAHAHETASAAYLDILKTHLDAVFGFPLLKCFFIMDQPWWEDNRPLNRYASSIPTRELKYDKSKDKTKGMVMVYTDRPANQFWTDYIIDDKNQRLNEQHKAEEWWVNKRNRRLWKRFVQYTRDYEHYDFTENRLLACGMRDWGKDPYGAAAHSWRPGVKSWETIDFLKAFSLDGEDKNKNIHVCGEAYSDYQGFIEGSLRSAEQVIEFIVDANRRPPESRRGL
ncbi:MAG TPA: FAD-dependent oxidoreductase [Methylocella sp.]